MSKLEEQTTEEKFATRARLEAAARWLEARAHLARVKGDERAARRFNENAMNARLRMR